jgi:hypothetical protein
MTRERTPTDYALEFAEYLAKRADQLIEAMNAQDEAHMALNELDDDDAEFEAADTAHVDAIHARVDQVRALRSAVYEFRKRRDRAQATPVETFPSAGLLDEALDVLAQPSPTPRGDR